jgi:hypothetical protein
VLASSQLVIELFSSCFLLHLPFLCNRYLSTPFTENKHNMIITCAWGQSDIKLFSLYPHLIIEEKRRRRWRYNFNLVNHAAASCWLRHSWSSTIRCRHNGNKLMLLWDGIYQYFYNFSIFFLSFFQNRLSPPPPCCYSGIQFYSRVPRRIHVRRSH